MSELRATGTQASPCAAEALRDRLALHNARCQIKRRLTFLGVPQLKET